MSLTPEEVLDRAVADRTTPSVVAEAGASRGPLWSYAAGRLTYDEDAPSAAADTIYDLASLTKVLLTTTLSASLCERGALRLDEAVTRWVPEWSADDRADVRVADLLSHASGLPAHRPFFERMTGLDAYVAAIAVESLEYAPRSQSVYSDLGFILLGAILERAGGASLEAQFARLWDDTVGPAAPAPVAILAPQDLMRTAPTEFDPWRGRLLRGEVHDENAAALGGLAGHAGLFGTVASVGAFARWWLRRLRGQQGSTIGTQAARRFAARVDVPGSSRALGWDTMRPTSSCGTRFSEAAIGHTGFTGTSLWLDPDLDRYAVLLSNRVHPTRQNAAFHPVRAIFHDALLAGPLRSQGSPLRGS